MIRLAQLTRVPLSLRIHSPITYTRQYFQDLNIDHGQIKRRKQQEEKAQHKEKIRTLASNDKNPDNYVKKLKIDHQAHQHLDAMREKAQVKTCAIIIPEPRKQPVLFSASKKYILTTLKKATRAMKMIRKKYLLDAILLLENSQKKVCKTMIPVLNNCLRHAKEKGLEPIRLYVHGVIIGKSVRFKGIRYHARGKSGRENKTLCQIKVIVEERDEKKFWEEAGSGQAPGGFANVVRTRLLDINASYEQLVQMGGITTAKGRQQKRQLIKRRVSMAMNQNEKDNTYVPKKIIEKQIKQQEGIKIKQLYKALPKPDYVSNVKKREKLFKKNMGIE